MKIKKILGLSALMFGSLVLTSNSFAQTQINRDSWTVSSNRNAADSFSAIDGNASTRWSTRERQTDGQFFQLDFNETHVINQVVLDTSASSNEQLHQVNHQHLVLQLLISLIAMLAFYALYKLVQIIVFGGLFMK